MGEIRLVSHGRGGDESQSPKHTLWKLPFGWLSCGVGGYDKNLCYSTDTQ
jgi:hypothetical protein